MARIESTQQTVKSKSEREVMPTEASVAFDPFLQVAVSVPRVEEMVIADGLAVGGQVKAGSVDVAEDVVSIGDLNPEQQAILKMMSSPPRGQDPLGMMAHVEQDLQGGSTAEKGVRAAANELPAGDSAEGEVAGGRVRSDVTGDKRAEMEGTKSGEGQTPQRLQNAMGEPSKPQAAPVAAIRAVEMTVQAVVKQGHCGVLQGARLEGLMMGRMGVAMGTSAGVAGVGGNGGSGGTGTVSAVAVTGVRHAGAMGDRGPQASGEGKGVGQGATGDEGLDAMKVQAQALRGVIAALRKKGESVTVVLRPEALGKVKVELKFGEGGVRGILTCSTNSARELLDETVDGLQRAMESRGIVVERLEVVHDATMDGFGDAGAGARQDEHAAGERGAGGTGQHERGMREMGQSAPSDDVELIAHDPAFTWNGSRMALSTLA